MEVNQTNEKVLIDIVKPSNKSWLLLLKSFWRTIWVFILILVFLGSLIPLFIAQFWFSSVFAVIVWFILIFLVAWFINFKIQKMQLDAIEYRFYNDRLEYVDGFLIKNKKSILYDRITDISQSQKILERFFDLWTLYIETAWHSSWLPMSYMENSEQLFEKINNLVKKNK